MLSAVTMHQSHGVFNELEYSEYRMQVRSVLESPLPCFLINITSLSFMAQALFFRLRIHNYERSV